MLLTLFLSVLAAILLATYSDNVQVLTAIASIEDLSVVLFLARASAVAIVLTLLSQRTDNSPQSQRKKCFGRWSALQLLGAYLLFEALLSFQLIDVLAIYLGLAST